MAFSDKSRKAYERGQRDGIETAKTFKRKSLILAELKFVRTSHVSNAPYGSQEYLDNSYWFGYRRELLRALSTK